MLAATQRVITLMVRTSATGSIAVRYRVSFAERLTSSSVRRCMRIHVFAASWASGAFGTSGTCGASGASGASSASGASAASGVTGVSVASAAYFSHLNERDLCGVWLSGSFQCRCNDGFELQGQFACVNVDECALGLAPCDRECEDTQGSYVCFCPEAGLVLDADGFTCNDINECLTPAIHQCSDVCVNTVGSFECACNGDRVLLSDQRTCTDTNAHPCCSVTTHQPNTWHTRNTYRIEWLRVSCLYNAQRPSCWYNRTSWRVCTTHKLYQCADECSWLLQRQLCHA